MKPRPPNVERDQPKNRRLAVFAGGCTLPAAVDVAGDAGDEYYALERLTALHDKSLLVVDRDTQAQPRYRMLETVRQYAEERLNEAGEGDEVRKRQPVALRGARRGGGARSERAPAGRWSTLPSITSRRTCSPRTRGARTRRRAASARCA